jgi:hypothetical protein
MIGLTLRLFDDNMDLLHVLALVCVLIWCALLEKGLEKYFIFILF